MSLARPAPLRAAAGALLAATMLTFAMPDAGSAQPAAQPAVPADPLPSRPAPGGSAVPVPTPVPVTPAPPSEAAREKAAEQKAVVEEAVKAAEAEAPEDAERAAACKAHALARLKARSPSVDDIFIDMDGLTIAKADMAVGSEKITGVLMGEAYIKRDRSDRAHRFLCLVGEKDKVVMTFLTER
ncbi:hypothetical protein ABLE93_03475 [Xanthobacter sp. KR7-65]|uniref:hypothetical protein n=1 Tax=Xanthobacter sp. KR7-65 TaxID=3156612 RepID=UPI0032B5F2FD